MEAARAATAGTGANKPLPAGALKMTGAPSERRQCGCRAWQGAGIASMFERGPARFLLGSPAAYEAYFILAGRATGVTEAELQDGQLRTAS